MVCSLDPLCTNPRYGPDWNLLKAFALPWERVYPQLPVQHAASLVGGDAQLPALRTADKTMWWGECELRDGVCSVC
eukprot:1896895-Amphidinium_carterae.1